MTIVGEHCLGSENQYRVCITTSVKKSTAVPASTALLERPSTGVVAASERLRSNCKASEEKRQSDRA